MSSQPAPGQNNSRGKLGANSSSADLSSAARGPAVQKENALVLKVTPVGNGIYPSKFILESAFDTRVIDMELTAQVRLCATPAGFVR